MIVGPHYVVNCGSWGWYTAIFIITRTFLSMAAITTTFLLTFSGFVSSIITTTFSFFIAITFGTMYAGSIAATLIVLSERMDFLVNLVRDLLSAL